MTIVRYENLSSECLTVILRILRKSVHYEKVSARYVAVFRAMFKRIPRNGEEDSGKCSKRFQGNVRRDSGECSKRFRGILKKIKKKSPVITRHLIYHMKGMKTKTLMFQEMQVNQNVKPFLKNLFSIINILNSFYVSVGL